MGLGGLVRCRTTMLWKPVWFPHQTRPLGPLICWVVCVLGDTCLLPQSSLLPAPHFPALSFSATATAGSAAFILRQPKRHIHIMWHQVILNMQDEYTSDICVCVCVRAHTARACSSWIQVIWPSQNWTYKHTTCMCFWLYTQMRLNEPHSNKNAVCNISWPGS